MTTKNHMYIGRFSFFAGIPILAVIVKAITLLFFSLNAHAMINLDANTTDSIAHFRAFPLYFEDSSKLPYVRHILEDEDGYIWMSGDPGLIRYNAYNLEEFHRETYSSSGNCGNPFIFSDSQGTVWSADCGLHKFNKSTNLFESQNITDGNQIRALVDDEYGKMWLGGKSFGIALYDKKTRSIVKNHLTDIALPENFDVYSLVYDNVKRVLWIASSDGIYTLLKDKQSLVKIPTPLDAEFEHFRLRDITLDMKRGELWVATSKGLLRVNTDSKNAKVYTPTDKKNSISTSDVTVTYMDSGGNIWVGLEKKGLCLFRHSRDDFTCVESAFAEPKKIPLTTIEDISEDSAGSLWLAVNNYGAVRITPDLEKFRSLNVKFKDKIPNYLPLTYGALSRKNGDIWLASDGGGINIYNPISGEVQNLRHDPKNKNSLPSDSVIALIEDRDGQIWAGFWAGGISRIDPDNLTFTNYRASDTQSDQQNLANDNIFVLEPDPSGGMWISVWGQGLQFFNPETNTFKRFFGDDNNEAINDEIVDIKIFNGKLWIAGAAGLETFDIESEKFETIVSKPGYGLNAISFESLDNMYLGTRNGLVRRNNITGEEKRYRVKGDGLADDIIYFLKRDSQDDLWIATNNGVSLFDEKNESFRNFYEKDGLTGNRLSTYGNFFEVDKKIYIPGRQGVSVIDKQDLPRRMKSPKTVLTNVGILNLGSGVAEASLGSIGDGVTIEIPYKNNSLIFGFTGLNYIFPEGNRFKYRLKGLQEKFTEVNHSERVARYTNLASGNYTFEVYASNGFGQWDEKGDKYPFVILSPWYATWWALLIMFSTCTAIIYFFAQLRSASKLKQEKALSAKVEKELSAKVKEKTNQLEQKANELKHLSHSLEILNIELEQRVQERTTELQVEVNERKVAESKLFHMAFHDPLTGLPNRQWLIKHLEEAIQRSKTEKDYRFCLMFLDGDRFKQINDTHGHSVGDQLLIASAKRLSENLKERQHVTRLGGDEFTIFAEEVESLEEMEALATQIINTFKQPFSLNNTRIFFSVSIGLAIYDKFNHTVPSVLRDADIAMYKAKEEGKGIYKVFDKEMRTATLALAELESDLHKAIESSQFYLMYQPLMDLRTDEIEGFEALVRWAHPSKGDITPETFIPLAEETGLIWQIGAWVLDEASRQLSDWHQMKLTRLPSISVNISSGQLQNSDFLNLIDSTITKHGVDSSFLKLELTESVLMENNKTIHKLLDELRLRNIDLAIDDFGTGYSSLAYLSEIPVQFIKIDKKFIDAIDCTDSGEINEDALEMVKATISLGKSLRKNLTAEGIKNAQQLEALRKLSCDFVQGYHIARPLFVEDATTFLISGYKQSS